MKRLLTIFICMATLPVICLGGELKVVSFTAEPFDISASTHKRLDLNERPCALVIVELPLQDCKFSGNVVGDSEFRTNEYWVYLTEHTKKFQIQAPGYPSLMVLCNENDDSGLAAQTTYRLKLTGYEDDVNSKKEYEKKLTELEEKLKDAQENKGKKAGPVTGTLAGHEWVDLGLPSGTKWATVNVGATKPTDRGGYYAWGETKVKKAYIDSTHSLSGKSLGDISGDKGYDVATAAWGKGWQMPTKEQMDELMEHGKWTWKIISGTEGYNVTGPNGSSIFLPAAGAPLNPDDDPDDDDEDATGNYWSGSQYGNYAGYVTGLFFSQKGKKVDWTYGYNGCSVRPVAVD